jgi:ribokinase
MAKDTICVLGSFVVDLTSRAPHLPVEGETVIGTVFKMGPGGKGSNQAVAAARSGGKVKLITKVGNDVFGSVAIDNFKKEGLFSDLIFVDNEIETGTALIMVNDNSANSILVVPGACNHIQPDEMKLTEATIASAAIFLTQLETNLSAIIQGIDTAHANGVPVVLNTAPIQQIPDELLAKVDIVTPNEIEAQILTGIEIKTIEDCNLAAEYFFSKGVKKVVITLGKNGVYANDSARHCLMPVYKVKAVDTTGAGDAFSGSFVTALAEGQDFFEAVKFGNVSAGLAVTRFGTAPAMAYRDEINASLLSWDFKYELLEN